MTYKTLKKCALSTLIASIIPFSNASLAVSEDHFSPKAAASKHAVFKFDSLEQLEAKARTLEGVEMRLNELKIFPDSNNQLQYIGLWGPGTGASVITTYSTIGSLNWGIFVAGQNGFKIVDVEPIMRDGSLTIHALFSEGTPEATNYFSGEWDDFNQWRHSEASQGRQLVDVDLYEVNGERVYFGTTKALSGGSELWLYSSFSDFDDKFDEKRNQGLALVDVEFFRKENGSKRRVGVWRSGSSDTKLREYNSWDEFKRKWAEKAEDGYALLDLDIGAGNTSNSYQKYIASYGPAPSPSGNVPDLEGMAADLENAFDSSTVVGMSYAISRNGQMAIAGATGLARRSNATVMTSDHRHHVASVTKMLTAPLLYNLLDRNGLSITDPVQNYLPISWRNQGISNSLTFEDLLRHETDSADVDADWNSIFSAIQSGINPTSGNAYKNVHYDIIKHIIPTLWSTAGGPTGNVTRGTSVNRYLAFMQELVGDIEGIPSLGCNPNASIPGVSFAYAHDQVGGSSEDLYISSQNAEKCGGSARLYISAQEAVRYWTAVRFNDDVINDTQRSQIRDVSSGRHGAGMNRWSGTGIAKGHGGDWNVNNAESHACLLELPDNIITAVFINSDVSGNSSSICDQIESAYQNNN